MARTSWYDPLRNILSKGSVTENHNGRAGLAAARDQHQGQFFTPDEVVRFMWALLSPSMEAEIGPGGGRGRHDFTIFDNSFGSGRMFQYADPALHALVGMEVDADLAPKVQAAAEAAGFHSELHVGSMTQFRPERDTYNVGIINPPFSLHLDGPEVYPYPFNAFGRYGSRSSAASHKYALAQALDCCRVVAAVMPRSFVAEAAGLPFFARRLHSVYHLPRDAFRSEGADVETSVLLFGEEALDQETEEPRQVLQHEVRPGNQITGPVLSCRTRWFSERHAMPRYDLDPTVPATDLPVTGSKRVRVVHSGRKVFLGFECALAQVLVMNRVLRAGYGAGRGYGRNDRVPKGLEFAGQGQLDLECYLATDFPVERWDAFLASIVEMGFEVDADPGIRNYLRKRDSRLCVLETPFRHTVRNGADGGFARWLGDQAAMRMRCTKMYYGAKLNDPTDRKLACKVGEVVEAERAMVGPWQRRVMGWKFQSKHHGWVAEDIQEWLLQHFAPDGFTPNHSWRVEHEGLKAAWPGQYRAMEARALALNLHTWCTWGFQFDDLIELALKRGHGIAAWEMGLGKARLALALCMLGGRRNLVVVEAHLIDEMRREAATLGLPDDLWQVIDGAAQCTKAALRRINIISYNRAKALADNTATTKTGRKRTVAKKMRGLLHTVVCDEGHVLRNMDTAQTVAMWALRGKARYVTSGTPISNYPRDILPLMQWVAGDGTALQGFGRHHFRMTPELVDDASSAKRGVDVFRDMFVTLEWVTNEFAENMSEGAKREVPKIADVAGFRAMVAPFLKRRIVEEPEVAAHVSIPTPERVTHDVPWDTAHLVYYVRVAREFVEWYRKLGEYDRKRNLVAILAKIGAVITAANHPQAGVAAVGTYDPLTSKQRLALDRIAELIADGQKVIFLAQSPGLIDFLAGHVKERLGFDPVLFHGGVTIAKRIRDMDKQFRFGPNPLLMATKGCLQTGYNIHQASSIIHYDRFWTPKVEMQADARALRPQQKKTVRIERMHLAGSIDMYQDQMCRMKATAMRSGLDYGDEDQGDKDFVHLETILHKFVEDFEATHGVEVDELIEKSRDKRGRRA